MWCLLALWILTPLPAAAQLDLNGVASYAQLSKEYYIVALYTTAPVTRAEELLASSADKRLELRLTAQQWTPFSFSQIWKRDLSINNDLSADAPQIKALLTFTDFPAEDLTTGDVIVANYSPALGTTIAFNGETFLQAEGAVLFNYLLSVWVGPSPPSRQFKADLLAGNAATDARFAALLERFKALRPQPERERLISRWRQAEAEEARQLAAARAEREAKAREAAERQAAEEAARLREQEVARERAAAAARSQQEAQAAAAAAASAVAAAKAKAGRSAANAAGTQPQGGGDAAPEAVTAGTAEAREIAAAEALAAVEAEKARLAAEAAAAEAAALAKAEAEARALEERRLAEARQVYERALYEWQMQRAVERQVTYPEWARQFGEEGAVEAEFLLDAQGQVVEYLRVEPGEGSLLAQELKAAIGRAAPFGPLPAPVDASADQPQTAQRFSVSHVFRLRGEQPKPLAKPEMPPILRQTLSEGLSDAQKAELVERYVSAVRTRIVDSITYPHWAKSMKQTGMVEVLVTIAADGSVAKTTVLQPSRHVMLNDEVVKAVERSAPFDPIPEELLLQSVDFSVSHQFGGR